MKRLNFAWRLFATGFSFAVFGLGGLILGLFLFPLLFVVVRDDRNRQAVARSLISKAFGAFVWMMKSLGALSYQVQGAEHICSNRSQLIIANHPTLIDVVFLVSLFPQTNCVIKEAVTRNPFMRSTVAAANYISNSETHELLQSCVARLKGGESLLLFPEGTRTTKGSQQLEFKLGAASVAVDSEAEILPILIRCTPPTLGKHEPWYKIPPRRFLVSIHILGPTSVGQLVPGNASPRHMKRALNKALLNIFSQALS